MGAKEEGREKNEKQKRKGTQIKIISRWQQISETQITVSGDHKKNKKQKY